MAAKKKREAEIKAEKERQRKREGFIFGGGVGLKGYLKMMAEGGKTRKGKPECRRGDSNPWCP